MSTVAQFPPRSRGGHVAWANRVHRLGADGARAEFLETVQSKTHGRPTRVQQAEGLWARYEQAHRRGRGGHLSRVPSSAGAFTGADLHPTTRAVLDYVTEHWRENGFSPSVRDIQVECELTSTSIVNYHLVILERLGSLTRVPGIARSIVLFTRVPVQVPA